MLLVDELNNINIGGDFMSRSYHKHPMMRVEKRSYNHKEMNRSFRRTSIEDTPANGNAYKKYGRINNGWD